MSRPIINVLNTTLCIYLDGKYPELTSDELDAVARIALDNLRSNAEFQDMLIAIVRNTLDEYVKNREEISETTSMLNEIDELKDKADKLGFKLQPKYPKVIVRDCICGAPRSRVYCTFDATRKGKIMRCHNCHLEGPSAKYNYKAKEAWNEMIGQKLIEKQRGDGD